MSKLLLYLLFFIPLIGFNQQPFSGKYEGIAKNDSIGNIAIRFHLNEDSTYLIEATFEYYSKVFTCYTGETWTYKGRWLSGGDYIYFKPCEEDGAASNFDKERCSCCVFPNPEFDFGTIEPEIHLSGKKEYKYRQKLYEQKQPYDAKGYTYSLWADPASDEIFFYYSWDCHADIWYHHSVKKLPAQ